MESFWLGVQNYYKGLNMENINVDKLINTLNSDLDLLNKVLNGVQNSIAIEVQKNENDPWDVEVCCVQDIFVGDNNSVLLCVELS